MTMGKFHKHRDLVGKVVCHDILKFNDTNTDTDMSWHVFFLATLANFSCRWTVGVDNIEIENDTKKITYANFGSLSGQNC